MQDHEALRRRSAAYYDDRLRAHGATPAGVDWNSADSQTLRFDELLRALESRTRGTILDYGCGYGALVEHLAERAPGFSYVGYDISNEMIATARERYTRERHVRFTSRRDDLEPADFVFASGTFNVKQDADAGAWEDYVLNELASVRALARRALAFNLLTAHADPEKMRAHLYYAEPATYLRHCLRTFSRDVSLHHDYGLYEFTVIVHVDRRPPASA